MNILTLEKFPVTSYSLENSRDQQMLERLCQHNPLIQYCV